MMGFFQKLFGKKEAELKLKEADFLEAGACPNCWGTQMYEGKYKEYLKDSTKSNINNDLQHQKAFVAQFVETNITGIRLKKDGDYLSCPKCQGKYKFKSSQAN